MDKRKLVTDFVEGRISADDLRRAAKYPTWNPIPFISDPIDPSGELCDDDACTFQTSRDLGPHFYEGMRYADYVTACRNNPHCDIVPTVIIFYRTDNDEQLAELENSE